jgi:putative (di)nucleoside polyphosphate hydrolase
VPLDVVIEFKREVYQRALQELSRFLTWPANGHDRRHHGSRYLRQPHPPRPNPEPPGSTCGTEAAAAAPPEPQQKSG